MWHWFMFSHVLYVQATFDPAFRYLLKKVRRDWLICFPLPLSWVRARTHLLLSKGRRLRLKHSATNPRKEKKRIIKENFNLPLSLNDSQFATSSQKPTSLALLHPGSTSLWDITNGSEANPLLPLSKGIESWQAPPLQHWCCWSFLSHHTSSTHISSFLLIFYSWYHYKIERDPAKMPTLFRCQYWLVQIHMYWTLKQSCIPFVSLNNNFISIVFADIKLKLPLAEQVEERCKAKNVYVCIILSVF